MSLGMMCMLNQCESRGRVRLVSADPHTPPLIDPDLLSHSEDMAALVYGVRACYKLATTEPMASIVEQIAGPPIDWDNDDEAVEAYVRATAGSTWHYSCTCRMGAASDPLAVLDQSLRVRGVSGLRVADASAMPAATSGNINAPTLMLAAKAADLVMREHGLSAAAIGREEGVRVRSAL